MTDNDSVLEIRNSRTKFTLIFLFFFCTLYVLALIMGISTDDFWNSFHHEVENWRKSWPIMVMMFITAINCLLCLKGLLDRRVQVRIDETGVYSRHKLNQTIKWPEIEEFSIGIIPFTGIKLKDPSKYRQTGMDGRFPEFNKYITGGDIYLPSLHLDISHKKILRALQAAHEKYDT